MFLVSLNEEYFVPVLRLRDSRPCFVEFALTTSGALGMWDPQVPSVSL